MIREYRIIRDDRIIKGEKHYAQTRTVKNFLGLKIKSSWKRIASHINGFGLYDHLDWPKSLEECSITIDKYAHWTRWENKVVVVKSY